MEFTPLLGLDEPPSSQAFKRGVLKPAPREFAVDVLGAAKHGGAYSYGMRISPLRCDDTRSVRSDRSWSTDYEIWRRWEDCLHFQEVLEDVYAQTSREKRKRLKNGKGVKKDGVYKTSDFAASFDSLPPGPDYQDIATDIHQYLPRLNRKGTLLRPNQKSIATRSKEFEALINALWQEDPPTLVRELREDMKVRDFFGFWRRDQDRLRKSGIQGPLASPSLYGTVSASSVSLVPTVAGAGGARSSHLPPMYLKPRALDDSQTRHRSIQDDNYSITSVPPYSPAKPQSSPSRRRGDSSGDEGPIGPITPRPEQDTLSDAASMKFVFDPTEMLEDDDATSVASQVLEGTRRPPMLKLQDSRTSPAHGIIEGPPAPPRSVLAAQSPRSPPLPPIPSPRMPRNAPQASPTSKVNRNYRIFASAPNPEDEDAPDAQYVIVPDGSLHMAPSAPHSAPLTIPPTFARSSPSQPNSSPPSSATNSIGSASSSGMSPSFFSTDEEGSSSRRSSWRTDSSVHGEMSEPQAKPSPERELPPIESLTIRAKDHAPVSYREPNHALGHHSRHSASSLETIHNQPADSISRTHTPSENTKTNRSPRPTPYFEETDDLLDTYFEHATLVRSPSESKNPDNRPTSSHSLASSSHSGSSNQSRECIHFDMPSPDRFPTPFQHRPPGQFHLPWSPTHPQHTPPYSGVFPQTSPTPIHPEQSPSFALKVMYGDAIVVLKVERTMTLQNARQRIYDKLVNQENLPLQEDFVLAYRKSAKTTAPIRPGGRARSNSASTVSTISTISSLSKVDPSQLSFLVLDFEWKNVVSTCGPKLTVIVLDS